jgi:SpoVK/Ycf46/Vps4 family AAA+-type ATPase
LLIVDTSKLVGSYVGESERNYRDLFRNFRYIEAVSSRAPIMFMDEADGFLGKRIAGAGNSRDRYVNIIQNIILEELNDFEGILLATTNLSSNLDDAMDRRFLVKIQFDIPDENTRKKIWKSRLPKVTDEDLAVVARDFSFSGGHIDNVATQAIIESIMNGTNTVTLESLIKYCKDEDSFTNKDSRKRIGF